MAAEQEIAVAPAARLGNVPRFLPALRKWWPYYVMLAPGVVFFAIWHYLPIWEARIAFEKVRIIPPNIWVGWLHFTTLFASPIFWQVLANTVIISAMKIAFVFPVPIVVALLLNELRSNRLRQSIQSVLYLPHFLGWVVISAIFIAQLSPSGGAVNDVLKLVGLKPVSFMTEPNWIRWILVISENWRSAGWDSLLYVAAIIGIDQTLYEAAEIDGAGQIRVITAIKLPAIRGALVIATIFSIIGSFQLFNEPSILKPLARNAITTDYTPNFYTYSLSFSGQQHNYSATVAIVMGLITMVIAYVVQLRGMRKGA